jgi:DNA polymerase-1
VSKRILLIDADVIAYEACAACEQEVEFEPGYFTYQSEFAQVIETFDDQLAKWKETCEGDEVKLCLTDSVGNFRKAVLPTYKGKRAKKPLALKYLKDYLIEHRGAFFRPGLEGDDCMGILATMRVADKHERVIVSPDKDMMQIPGLFIRWPNPIVRSHTRSEADLFHLTQTLTGDVTDGYGGCPGIGPVKAEKLLAKDPSWSTVVAAYEAAGLTEADALVQARVARILRATDYDFQKKEPILWTPTA